MSASKNQFLAWDHTYFDNTIPLATSSATRATQPRGRGSPAYATLGRTGVAPRSSPAANRDQAMVRGKRTERRPPPSRVGLSVASEPSAAPLEIEVSEQEEHGKEKKCRLVKQFRKTPVDSGAVSTAGEELPEAATGQDSTTVLEPTGARGLTGEATPGVASAGVPTITSSTYLESLEDTRGADAFPGADSLPTAFDLGSVSQRDTEKGHGDSLTTQRLSITQRQKIADIQNQVKALKDPDTFGSVDDIDMSDKVNEGFLETWIKYLELHARLPSLHQERRLLRKQLQDQKLHSAQVLEEAQAEATQRQEEIEQLRLNLRGYQEDIVPLKERIATLEQEGQLQAEELNQMKADLGNAMEKLTLSESALTHERAHSIDFKRQAEVAMEERRGLQGELEKIQQNFKPTRWQKRLEFKRNEKLGFSLRNIKRNFRRRRPSCCNEASKGLSFKFMKPDSSRQVPA